MVEPPCKLLICLNKPWPLYCQFQAIASAPPVRETNHLRRPASSQNVKFAIGENNNNNNRASRKPNKMKRSNTANTVRPNSRLTRTRSRNGKSLENKRSPSDDRKR